MPPMKGLELSRRYWAEVGRPFFEARCPRLLERAAVGLVGEGSECFGYDDELSRDHDWGPGFCMWLGSEDLVAWGAIAEAAYADLPREYLGLRRSPGGPESDGRIGVLDIPGFYFRRIGLTHPPRNLDEWRAIPESGLATCTNGEVFCDPTGEFSSFREALLSYYPEDLRRKRLAARLAGAAQAGQYNYPRSLRRHADVAAFQSLAEFVDHAQAAVFLLARRFRPFYKWAHRAMGDLPGLGQLTAPLFEGLTTGPGDHTEGIEGICALVVEELRRQGLSTSADDFLLSHAREVQAGIEDEALRGLPLLAG